MTLSETVAVIVLFVLDVGVWPRVITLVLTG